MSQFALPFTIKPSSVRKDGTCMVYLLYCFSQKQKPLFDSRIATPPCTGTGNQKHADATC